MLPIPKQLVQINENNDIWNFFRRNWGQNWGYIQYLSGQICFSHIFMILFNLSSLFHWKTQKHFTYRGEKVSARQFCPNRPWVAVWKFLFALWKDEKKGDSRVWKRTWLISNSGFLAIALIWRARVFSVPEGTNISLSSNEDKNEESSREMCYA